MTKKEVKPSKIIDVPEAVREILAPRFDESNKKGNDILLRVAQKRRLEKEIEQLFTERESLTKEITERIKVFMDTINEDTESKTVIYNPDKGRIEIY